MLERNWLGHIFGLTLLVLFLGSTAWGETVQPKGKKLLEDFDYHGVTLDGGRMRAQMEEVCDEYLRIPNDDLLKGFRQRAGLPAPGVDLGGWYTHDVFHVFGQIVSGLSRMYAATGNAACRDKANALVAEWAKCIAPDGYFYFSAKPNAPHYTYDKMLWGLLDSYLYCDNKEALGHLSRITDWAIKNLEHTRELGPKGHEWYTLSENLYRAYLVTGDAKYRDFAKVWEYTEYWDMYARKADIFSVRPDGQQHRAYHAYSHVNTLGGAGAAYLVTGEPRYLEILSNAYDYLQANETFATGGFGPDEQLLPHDKLLAKLATSSSTFETQCGTWACFKMVKHLLCYTGDARYGDWAERLAINGIGASIHMTPGGRVFYYSDYCTEGGEKANHGTGWTCCTGTRPQAVADFCDLIYFKDADNLCVNLFAPSTVRWPRGGTDITLRQTTRFPENGKVEFTLESDRPAEFGLKIRSPRWLAGPMTALLNGEPVSLAADASHWCTLRRVWKSGDRLAIVLPMRLEVSRFTPGQAYPATIVYGPVVLAARAADLGFIGKIDLEHLDRDLTAVAGETLSWRLSRDAAVLVRPFYVYKEGELYYLYLDPAAGQHLSNRDIIFRPRWNVGHQFRYTNIVGATAQYAFAGIGIRWRGLKFDDAGRAEVTIDGRLVAIVDQYGPGRNLPFEWSYRTLRPGKHTIQLKLMEEKTLESKDRYINVAGFEALPAPGQTNAAGPAAAGADHRPNILFALADDWAWPHAGAYGDKVVQTPTFDRVAREGVLFNCAYVAAPTCTASRGGMLTGQAIHRLEHGANLNGMLPNKFKVYPDLLKEAGYVVGFTRKGWGPGTLQGSGRTRNPAGPVFKNFAEFFMTVPQGKPFCFWFGSTDPHRNYVQDSGVESGMKPGDVVVPPFLPDTLTVRKDILDYYFAVQRYDRETGEIIKMIEDAGQLNNTIIVMSGDNGIPFPRAKATLYDAGTHAPLAVRWPARVPGGRVVDDFVSLVDLAPTLLEAAALAPPPEITGRSFLDVLLSGKSGRVAPRRDRVVTERELHVPCRADGKSYPVRALRTYEYLYIRNLRPDLQPAGDSAQRSAGNGPGGKSPPRTRRSRGPVRSTDLDLPPRGPLDGKPGFRAGSRSEDQSSERGG